jgi:hypothetical protein
MAFSMRMRGKTIAASAAVLAIALVLGGGCFGKKNANPGSAEPPSSAETAASPVILRGGSSFLIQQEAIAFEGKFDLVEPKQNKRRVTLASFQPGVSTNIDWEWNQLVLTDEAKSALKAYEDGGKQGDAPKPSYGQIQGGGTLSDIGLKSHDLSLPAEWDVGDRVDRAGTLFVSGDVYQELSRTGYSTVFIDVANAARMAVGGDEAQNAFLKEIADRAKSLDGKTEVDLMKAEPGRVDYPVKINGMDSTVKAIKAKNWYGEILVLDDPQNPLVLRFDFNPDLEGIKASEHDVKVLKGLLSYSVTEINP